MPFSLPDHLPDLMPDWARLFQGQTRWLRLEAQNTALFADALVLSFHAREAVSDCGICEVDILSPDVNKQLKDCIAEPLTLCLDTDDLTARNAARAQASVGVRRIAGLVARAEQLGSDGGATRYRLHIQPALSALNHSAHNRVFQDRSVVQIVDTLLGEYTAVLPELRWRWQLARAYPTLPCRTQFRETDLAFIRRTLAAAGIFWFIRAGVQPGEHEIIFCDDNRTLHGDARWRYHRAAMSESRDSITHWQAHAHFFTGGFSVTTPTREGGATYSAEAVSAGIAGAASAQERGKLDATAAAFWRHRFRTPDSGLPASAADHQAGQLRDHQGVIAQQYSGRSSIRQMQVAEVFSLLDHPQHESGADARFFVLAVEHRGRNELEGRRQRKLLQTENSDLPLYENSFEVIPHRQFWQPGLPPAPLTPGLQRALVTGSGGDVIHTDVHGRVKVCFAWQRSSDHRPDDTGSAVGNDKSSCWLPVLQRAAGNDKREDNLPAKSRGALFLPRVGDEVLVGFIDDDIDQPVVLHSLYHHAHHPPGFKAVSSLPADKALTGIRSVEHQGTRASELIFDDTTHQPHVTLRSDHGDSHLQLGVLTGERAQGRAHLRGEGLDLFTGRWGAVRGAFGVLVQARSNAGASDHHWSRGTLLGQIDSLHANATALEDAAGKLKTQPLMGTGLDRLQNQLTCWQIKDAAPNNKPMLALHADAGLLVSSSEATLITARDHLDVRSTQAIGIHAGTRWTNVSTGPMDLWSWTAGITLTAGGGDLSLRAHREQIIMEANSGIRLSAIDGALHIESAQDIVLTAGGYTIRIGKDIEFISDKPIDYKGVTQHVTPGAALVVQLPELDKGPTTWAPQVNTPFVAEAVEIISGTAVESAVSAPSPAPSASGMSTTGASSTMRGDGVATNSDVLRGMGSRGARNTAPLTSAQETQLFRHVEELGLNPDDFRISSHMSAYSDNWDVTFLGPNMFPAEARTARTVFETLTPRAAVAHEAGHMLTTRAGTAFEAGSLYDEVGASLTGRQLPGLNNVERYQLLRDAVERARVEGRNLRDVLSEMGGGKN